MISGCFKGIRASVWTINCIRDRETGVMAFLAGIQEEQAIFESSFFLGRNIYVYPPVTVCWYVIQGDGDVT